MRTLNPPSNKYTLPGFALGPCWSGTCTFRSRFSVRSRCGVSRCCGRYGWLKDVDSGPPCGCESPGSLYCPIWSKPPKWKSESSKKEGECSVRTLFVERTWSETAFIADYARFYDNELEKRPYPTTANILQAIGADLTPTYPVRSRTLY